MTINTNKKINHIKIQNYETKEKHLARTAVVDIAGALRLAAASEGGG
jgi:hypothetical protein